MGVYCLIASCVVVNMPLKIFMYLQSNAFSMFLLYIVDIHFVYHSTFIQDSINLYQ